MDAENKNTLRFLNNPTENRFKLNQFIFYYKVYALER